MVNKFDKMFYEDIKKVLRNRLFIGVAGLRVVGKTVLLRQLSKELENSFYISMDALDAGINFFERPLLFQGVPVFQEKYSCGQDEP